MCITPICEAEKHAVLIEFLIFFIFKGIDIGNHCGIFFMLREQVVGCANVIATSKPIKLCNGGSTGKSDLNATILGGENITIPGSLTACIFCVGGANGTASSLRPAQEHLSAMHLILLSIIGIGGLLFIIHIAFLLPNLIKSFTESDMESYRLSSHPYYRSILKGHCLLLVLESLLFDIPAGSTVMEIIAQMWKYPNNFNCWECATSLAGVGAPKSLEASKMYLAMSVIGITFISLYKGMMPIYLWIGNPFCFPCIPLRLLVVFPGGLIALVMTLGPVFGIAQRVLIPFSPPEFLAEVKGVSETFFSIGMIFWGIFGIMGLFGGACWWKFCREGSDKGGGCSCC